MLSILPLLLALTPSLSKTQCRQLAHIAAGMLSMSGRITQRGISRWTLPGGSYRTIQRFFQSVVDWPWVSFCFFARFCLDREGVYLLAGDESVITKSGKHTHGVDRFFASLFDKAVPAIALFSLALIDVKSRQAYSLSNAQIVRSTQEKAATALRKAQAQRLKHQRKQRSAQKSTELPQIPPKRQGRPKGSKNKDKDQVVLNPELGRILVQAQQLLMRLHKKVKLTYFVLDGHFGNHCAAAMVRQLGLHIITKMRSDTGLYLELTAQQKREHPHQKYGDKIDYQNLPQHLLRSCTSEGDYETRLYQVQCWHKEFSHLINVTILVRRHVLTHQRGHILLMSTDLELAAEQMLDYYGLRFQIEFSFRDAKQHFGLEDFMAVTPSAVANGIGLSMFMGLLSTYLLKDFATKHPGAGILDLKSACRGRHYLHVFIKMLPDRPDAIIYERLLDRITQMGSIHGQCPCAPQSLPMRC